MHRILFSAALVLAVTSQAMAQQEGAVYPDWSGQWNRVGGLAYPPEGYQRSGPPPLTPEYQAIWERYQALKQEGAGPAGDPPATCLPPGMPRVMTMSFPMEIIITPEVTYLYAEWDSQFRRIYTDGRSFDDDLAIVPNMNGYSIGEWRDADGDGVYDTLAVETRAIAGERSFDSSSVPLHENDSTVVLEEFRLIDERTLENRLTTIDDALTEPWTVHRRYTRETEDYQWVEYVCVENNRHIRVGDEWYFVNYEEGTLDPTRVGPPQLAPAGRAVGTTGGSR